MGLNPAAELTFVDVRSKSCSRVLPSWQISQDPVIVPPAARAFIAKPAGGRRRALTCAVVVAVTTAVVPVAGRGTRLRPATRALPKEMLPVGGRPVVQHVVEELAANGIERVLFVTAPGKEAIEEHFVGDTAAVQFASVIQPAPRGLGDAILRAEGHTGEGPFAVAQDIAARPPVH